GTAIGRAAPDLPEDYNPDGTYVGNDGIMTLDIYMRSSDGTIEAKRFADDDIATDGTVFYPSEPFRTTSGVKTVYVVVNDPNPLETSITSEDTLVDTDGLARYATQNGNTYDVITMTGKAENVTIEPDIPVTGVTAGENHVEVTVNRVASRVIVTISPDASETLEDEDGNVIGTVSNVTWTVAQGTTKIYWIEQPNYVSYGYDYVPALGEYYGGDAVTYYDYSQLDDDVPVPYLPTAGDGYKSLPGKFLFENTHQYGATQSTTDYRKGNTAYVLVKAIFTPSASAIADGGTLTNGTFYYGYSDGKIYSSKVAAQAAVQNQKVAVYQGGKMLNYAWLNPDSKTEPLNSPVVRNNIYHINITGFRRLAYNWNPLYPGEEPGTTNPENPDPKPLNPDEPENPIDPIDPLTPEETFMTVDVTVQDWWVHSYDIEF
ncbi:MAG: Mfa1 family fimbria major subunit, partial [Alistipes sp.]|nr:Mfa1 family fimbria major subunit [Alistipes sp.]